MVSSMLYLIIIQPLALVLEFVFSVGYKLSGNAGVAILGLSICVNMLTLPLYKRADALQREETNRAKSMEHWVRHIKKAFRGDEKTMMLQTYYRQCGYKQIYAVRGSLPLLLQIPFFIAAYGFLSDLKLLEGMRFLMIKDLGLPDGLIRVGGNQINILPILMTLVNLASSVVYMKEEKVTRKLQAIIVALVFLMLLYKSPSGLVLYWLLNNVFSLVKNIVQRHNLNKRKKEKKIYENKEENKGFFVGAVCMTLITGVMIPLSVIYASPEEFINLQSFNNPIIYVFRSCMVAAGLFVVWSGLYYCMAGKQARNILANTMICVCILSMINYMFMGKNQGLMSSALRYDNWGYQGIEYLVNTVEMAAVGCLVIVACRKYRKTIAKVLGALVVVVCFMSAYYFISVNASYQRSYEKKDSIDTQASFPISKNGKNVVVIMVDRAMSQLVPYIFAEKPELKQSFDGFTFYENTVSFGIFTNTAAPAVFGGYEYTPDNMNKRDDELLKDKNNEALKVMPVLFSEHGFDVTVSDPPYAGYEIIPDLSIFSDYPAVHTYITNGKYNPFQEGLTARTEEIWRRDFFCYGLLRTAPALLQPVLYDDGHYNEVDATFRLGSAYGLSEAVPDEKCELQTMDGLYKSSGYSKEFLDAYGVLDNLNDITHIEDSENDTFLMFYNMTAHEPCYLQMPEYTPELLVDNTSYSEGQITEINGRIMHLDTQQNMSTYQVNMATYLKLGEWFDYLRQKGVYDNTRIILVADHGTGAFFDDTKLKNANIERLSPLLMVKDYNEHGFKVSDEFMTNADVPGLATNGIIDSPKNPFTGKMIDNNSMKKEPQLVLCSDDTDIKTNNRTTFAPGWWFTVKDNMFDRDNWERLGYH